jgi:hypothetical protein
VYTLRYAQLKRKRIKWTLMHVQRGDLASFFFPSEEDAPQQQQPQI